MVVTISHPVRRLSLAILLIGLIATALGCHANNPVVQSAATRPFEGRKLILFVGSASQPPTELAAKAFEERTGAKLEVHFGGSGEMLSKMKLSGTGDIFFPGSSDYIEIAKREGVIDPESETIVAYLVPAINVPIDNPKGVGSLEDLAKPGMRIAIARPDTVCVGLYAVEVLEKAGIAAKVRPNIVTNTESCAKMAQIVAMGQIDAVIGWEVFESWEPTKIKTIYLPKELVPRIGFLPAAIGVNSSDRELAQAFLDFIVSPEGQAIYRKWNYLTTVEEARRYTMPDTPVGGEWPLPAGW
jgi:molybdate transport system substrate-binding protein